VSLADQYARNEDAALAMVARTPKIVAELLQLSNFEWAAHNCRLAAEAYFDLGLLHWRRGEDPRHDFRGAIMHHGNLTELVKKHRLSAGDFDMSPVYAAMFLMGAKAPLVFFNEASYETQRWPCYEARIVHALFDEEPGAGMAKLVESHAARNDELPERLLDVYLQLLGLRESKADLAERVLRAKSAWAERKREELVERGPAWNGHGVMNDLYIDFYLAAILKKIGVKAQTIHTWNWD
jgi:hypothetical protein